MCPLSCLHSAYPVCNIPEPQRVPTRVDVYNFFLQFTLTSLTGTYTTGWEYSDKSPLLYAVEAARSASPMLFVVSTTL